MFKLYMFLCFCLLFDHALSNQLCRVNILKKLGSVVGFGPYRKFMAQHDKNGDILSLANGEILLDNGKSYQCNRNGNWNKIPKLEGKHYRLILAVETSPNAYKKCRSLGGNMAKVHDMRLNDVFTMIMRKNNVSSALIGYSDSAKEGIWEWDSKKIPKYGEQRVGKYVKEFTNWRKGQPNNAGVGEDYAVMSMINGAEGQWFDVGPPKEKSLLAPSTPNKFPYWCEIETLTDYFKRSIKLDNGSNNGSDYIVSVFNGRDPSEGQLLVEVENGQWGNVCHNKFTSNSAIVVCRSLGFRLGGDYSTNKKNFKGSSYLLTKNYLKWFKGSRQTKKVKKQAKLLWRKLKRSLKRKHIKKRSTGEILIGDVECKGDEKSLFQCPHSDIQSSECKGDQSVWVMCFKKCPKSRYISSEGTCLPCNKLILSETTPSQMCPHMGLLDPQAEEDPVCGVRQLFTASARIVGGEKAETGEYPWQVAIKRGGFVICGGSIIDRTTVITAAHCVQRYISKYCYNADTEKEFKEIVIADSIKTWPEELTNFVKCSWVSADTFEVEAGVIDFLSEAGFQNSQTSKIKKIYVSRRYVYVNGNIHNDIAVLKLSEPFNFNDYVYPACLPTRLTELPSGASLIITGFGALQASTKTANVLHKARVSSIARNVCNASMKKRVSKNMICAGEYDGGLDACAGDSGGPLGKLVMVKSKFGVTAQYIQMGVISWGVGCARARLYGVYTDIRKFLGFVEEARKESSTLEPSSFS